MQENFEGRSVVDLSNNPSIQNGVEVLDNYWRATYGGYESVFFRFSRLDFESQRLEIKDQLLELIESIKPFVGEYSASVYRLEMGTRMYTQWHYDSRPVTMVHFGNVATTDIYTGSSARKGFTPRDLSKVTSMPSNLLFRLEPTDYHRRGESKDLLAFRQVLFYYH